GVYSNETHVYFHAPSLKSHMDSIGVAIKPAALWNLVRERGGARADLKVTDSEGLRRHVRCWSVPKNALLTFAGEPEPADTQLEEEEIF
ncbi:MAG TPA: hypothetical protein VNL71_20415, partial [Chloroflexota bacterium]|nr:hypothetical protein [Chloroflexota bacterium]